MTATTTTPSIFRMFYTHKRTQMLLEAKGIRVKNIEKVSISKPSGAFYNCVHVIYTTVAGRCSTFISFDILPAINGEDSCSWFIEVHLLYQVAHK